MNPANLNNIDRLVAEQPARVAAFVNNPAANDFIDQLVVEMFGEDGAMPPLRFNAEVDAAEQELHEDEDEDEDGEDDEDVEAAYQAELLEQGDAEEEAWRVQAHIDLLAEPVEADYIAANAVVIGAQAAMQAAEDEEGCCICLNPPEDVDEWQTLTCGVNGHHLHRVCKPCYINCERNGKRMRGMNVEAFEEGMKVVECPICRHLQAPTLTNYRDRCKEQYNRIERTERNLREENQRGRRLQNDLDRAQAENRRRANPPPVQAAGGGRGVRELFTTEQTWDAQRQRAQNHIVGGMSQQLSRIAESARIREYNAQLIATRNAYALVATEQRDVARLNGILATINEQPAAVRVDPQPTQNSIAAAELRVFAAEEAIEVVVAELAAMYRDFDAREIAYVNLFIPDYDEVEARLRVERRQDEVAERAAEALGRARREANRVRRNEVDAQNVVHRRQVLIQNIANRRDGMDAAAWARQRETCWCKLNGQPCDTAQKTRRFCSVVNCNNKVCRACDVCGNH